MSLDYLKVTFVTDGTGVFAWPKTPPHLDGLIAWAILPFQNIDRLPPPDKKPVEFRLPLGTWERNGHWGWSASAISPEGEFFESTQFYRRRSRGIANSHMVSGQIGLQSGQYSERNLPMPLILCKNWVAYCVGRRKRIYGLLARQIGRLGAKGSMGKGKVLKVEVEKIENDWSLMRDGKAMRYLPVPGGRRNGRIRPPYHNRFDPVQTCYPGDELK